MLRAALLVLLWGLAGCATARAQGAHSFGDLAGQWTGRGQFQGAASEVAAEFAPLFDGQAWSLDIEVNFAPAPGRAARFQGRAGYTLRDGAPAAGAWIDSEGNAYAIAPHFESGALIVDWGGGGVSGRSEYRLDSVGGLHILDFVQAADGQWRAFANAELHRAR